MESNNCRGRIKLVYSSSLGGNEAFRPEPETSVREWEQFELFASKKPDVMIFAQPDLLGFDGIVEILAKGQVRTIFDLREVPFISFGNETRESFLKLLMKNQVEYFNIFRLRDKLGKHEKHCEHEEEAFFSLDRKEIKRILKPMIETGPVVVFSDCAPTQDKTIKGFLDLLSRAEIPHSPVDADNL